MPSDSLSKTLAQRELYKKLENNYKIVESYRPNPKIAHVTTKFYARHEFVDLTKVDEELMNHIYYLRKDLKEKVSKPDSVNHSYGWYIEPLVKIDRSDRRYFCPRVSSENTKIMESLAENRALKLEKFTGIPFKL
ncbi:protein FAM183A-like [Chrysoperla carnea]|uniref:protein FAM183A-like n=1 Tax=Chrysoperla carnea TaxID=189513 RepID=UPI001D0783AF|nr:protein FAM183A-like [Chrysoperla carnea]